MPPKPGMIAEPDPVFPIPSLERSPSLGMAAVPT